MKKQLLVPVFLLLQLVSFSQSVQKTMLRLPDTGQNSGYTSTFGEDNDYTINPPYFLVNPDGTVTDTVTGLMWQQDDGGEMTFESALLYCDSLTTGGYTDWRLPSAHESFSIFNHQFANPALDTTVFTKTVAEYWWTNDRQANDATKVWVTNAGGGIGNHPKDETLSAGGTKRFHVRAVRDVQNVITLPTHFEDNNDGTVTDKLTGLVWQKLPYWDSLNWEMALTYADTLSLAGKKDWRLPNIKELQSINQENILNPSLNTAFFSIPEPQKIWSSTTLPNQTSKAWYLDTRYGVTTYDPKTARHILLVVRGGAVLSTGLRESDYNRLDVEIQPNPFSRSLRISGSEHLTKIELISVTGEVLYSGNAIKIEEQDFSFLPEGLYFLRITGKDILIKKVVKE